MGKDQRIGVIVGRFQLNQLHAGHVQLLRHVYDKHQKAIVFLGVGTAMVSKKNPMDYPTREKMIKEKFPNAVVSPVQDKENSHDWSEQLDKKIREIFQIGEVILYGGRDSFIKEYTGSFPYEELDFKVNDSASEERADIAHTILDSPDFRAGVVYAAHNQYPSVFQTVDVAILRADHVLLGRKKDQKQWRFIGGFVDVKDESLERAAKREALEETDMEIDSFTYLASLRVDDWRYRGEESKIMTAFFKAWYIYGSAIAKDDIFEVNWFKINEELHTRIREEHKPLVEILLKDYNSKYENHGQEKLDTAE